MSLQIISVLLIVLKTTFAQSAYGTLYGTYGSGNYGSATGSSVFNNNCACGLEFRPVCASNGKTFSNICLLRCDQASNPSIVQMSEGPCLTGSGGYGSLTGTGGYGSTSPYNFGPVLGGSSSLLGYGGSNIALNTLACAWQCPTTASTGAYGGAYGTSGQSQYGSYGAGYGNGLPVGGSAGIYGLSGTGSLFDSVQICDNRGNSYINDCQYYRAVCENDKRGIPLSRGQCGNTLVYGGSANSLYGGTSSFLRSGALYSDAAATTKAPVSG